MHLCQFSKLAADRRERQVHAGSLLSLPHGLSIHILDRNLLYFVAQLNVRRAMLG